MRERLNDIRDRVRAQGWRPVAGLIWSAIRERVSPPWYVLYWIPLAETKQVPAPAGAVFQVISNRLKELSLEQNDLLVRGMGRESMPIVDTRLTRGALLHVLWQDGRVAGTLFTLTGREQHFQHAVLTERDAIVLDARIVPEFRGRGLYPVLLARVADALRERALERLYIATAESNTASLRSYDKVGFRFLVRYHLSRERYRFSEKPL